MTETRTRDNKAVFGDTAMIIKVRKLLNEFDELQCFESDVPDSIVYLRFMVPGSVHQQI